MSLPTRTLIMGPGYLCLPTVPTRLCTVIASGVAITVYDRRQGFGGVGHFTHPRRSGRGSSPSYAAPAIVGLTQMFFKAGSRPCDLETYLYGGADNPEAPDYDPERGWRNSRVGFEILPKLGIRIAGHDLGGRFARKLMFCTGTGESFLAKIDDAGLDASWYPRPETMANWAS